MTLPLLGVEDPDSQFNFDRISLAFPGAVLHTSTPTTSGPTTTSTADPPSTVLSEMTITADYKGNIVLCLFNGNFSTSGGSFVTTAVADGGTVIANSKRYNAPPTSGTNIISSLLHAYSPGTGSRTIDVRWSVGAGTGTATGTQRQFVILELRN